jgi:cytosine/adenosine deaminase-related metal-dependent hydrolase
MTLTRGAINRGFADGGIADQPLMQDHEAAIADCVRALARYHDPREGAFTRVALAPCAPFNVTRQLMIDTAGLAEQLDCLLHTHLAETGDEDDFCADTLSAWQGSAVVHDPGLASLLAMGQIAYTIWRIIAQFWDVSAQ